MTRHEKASRIADMREQKYYEQGGRCFVCHQAVRFAMFQLAHIIPQRRWCVDRWGEDVIHNSENIRGTCCLECNAKVQMNPNSIEADQFAKQIKEGQL